MQAPATSRSADAVRPAVQAVEFDAWNIQARFQSLYLRKPSCDGYAVSIATWPETQARGKKPDPDRTFWKPTNAVDPAGPAATGGEAHDSLEPMMLWPGSTPECSSEQIGREQGRLTGWRRQVGAADPSRPVSAHDGTGRISGPTSTCGTLHGSGRSPHIVLRPPAVVR